MVEALKAVIFFTLKAVTCKKGFICHCCQPVPAPPKTTECHLCSELAHYHRRLVSSFSSLNQTRLLNYTCRTWSKRVPGSCLVVLPSSFAGLFCWCKQLISIEGVQQEMCKVTFWRAENLVLGVSYCCHSYYCAAV